MAQFITTDDRIRAIIPNIQKAVTGQTTWSDRLASFFDEAVVFIERYVAPLDLIQNAGLEDLLEKSIIWRAWARAIPSLDLVATPNGFAVVSNDTLSPASKPRTEEARNAALIMADNKVCDLVVALFKSELWRSTPHARYFHTLFPDPRLLKHEGHITAFEWYIMNHAKIERCESMLAVELLSAKGLRILRGIAAASLNKDAEYVECGEDDLEILALARSAVVAMMEENNAGLRNAYRRIRVLLDNSNDSFVADAWRLSSLYRAFKSKDYENKKESGGFFF